LNTKPVDAGIRMPRVPPAATAPVDRRFSWRNRSISPNDTRPMLSAEAAEEPESAAKPPQATTVAEASPPRIEPIVAGAAS